MHCGARHKDPYASRAVKIDFGVPKGDRVMETFYMQFFQRSYSTDQQLLYRESTCMLRRSSVRDGPNRPATISVR